MLRGFFAPGIWPAAALPYAETPADDGTPDETPPSQPDPPQPVVTLRAATAGYFSLPTRGAAGAGDPISYPPRVMNGIEIGQSALDALGAGGRVALTVAEIEVHDADGWAAEMARYGSADGRTARLRVVQVVNRTASDFGVHLADVPTHFQGVVRSVSRAGPFRARVALGDLADRLDQPLQPKVFAGTGGLEGGEALKDRPLPICLGAVFNVPPVPLGNVDLGVGIGSLPTFRVHWRRVRSIAAVRVRGVAMSSVAGTPGVGQYRPFNDRGLFQIGGAAEGAIRADVQGDDEGTYASTHAGILDRGLRSLAPALIDPQFDLQAWAVADSDLPGEVGWFRGPDPTTALQFADEVCRSCMGVLAGGRTGALRLFDPIAKAYPQFMLREPWVADLNPEATPGSLSPPPSEVKIEWGRNWGRDDDVAGSVDATLRERLTSETSPYAAATSTAVKRRVSKPKTMTLAGLYATQAAAQARANQIAAWIALGPRFVTLSTDRYLGQVELGHVGAIASYPAYGLEAGMTGCIMGWREQIDARRLEITLAEVAPAAAPGPG